jgi:AcrR family transcriptional regulator
VSPRPRKVSDDQLFAAAHALMNRVGPAELTLSAIARRAGVTPAVLVQRFGSKRNLLLALSERFAAHAGELMAAFGREHRSPLAALGAYAECMAASPAAFARSLAYLQIDLTDPDFRKPLMKQARATREGLERLIAAAIDAGELVAGAKPAQLARTIEAVISGSLLAWAFHQRGTAARWVRTDLDAVLEPYVPKRTGSVAAGRRRSPGSGGSGRPGGADGRRRGGLIRR